MIVTIVKQWLDLDQETASNPIFLLATVCIQQM